jgi:hypothetical protein
MYLIRACLYIYTAAHKRAHMSPAASSAQAVARTCTWTRCSHVQDCRLFITKASIDLHKSDPSIAIYTQKHVYPHGESYTRARARSHAQAPLATHTCCMSHPVIRTKTTIYTSTHMAIYRFGSDVDGAPGAERMQCTAESAADPSPLHTDPRIHKPDTFQHTYAYIYLYIYIYIYISMSIS